MGTVLRSIICLLRVPIDVSDLHDPTAMPGAMRLIHSRDNQWSIDPTTAGQQNRRQVLVCSWYSGLGDGRLECSWHIEPADDSLGQRAGPDRKPGRGFKVPTQVGDQGLSWDDGRGFGLGGTLAKCSPSARAANLDEAKA